MIEIVGYIASACCIIAFFPQILKVLRTQRSKDISIGLLVLLVPGEGDHGMTVAQEPLRGFHGPRRDSEVISEYAHGIGFESAFDTFTDCIVKKPNIMRRRVRGKDSDLLALMIQIIHTGMVFQSPYRVL